jgi:hypothetical protein
MDETKETSLFDPGNRIATSGKNTRLSQHVLDFCLRRGLRWED